MSIAVVGESLIDLIRQSTGDFRPHLGGSPYNVARGLARQQIPVGYLSPLSTDGFGDALGDALVQEGVVLPGPRSTRPTSLAVVTIDDAGTPSYALYREGVADRDVTADTLLSRIPDDAMALHTGSLALVPADVPMVRQLLEGARERGLLVAVDVNMRPMVEPDLDAYVAGVKHLLPLCDLVKASDEDLAVLGLGDDPLPAAHALWEAMEGGLVALTEGAAGAALVRGGAHLAEDVWPVSRMVDTVGCGDTFHAGLLAGLFRGGLLTAEAIRDAPLEDLRPSLDRARVAAALNAQRAGADPPTWQEVTTALLG